MLLDMALVSRNCTGMALQLDNITVIPFLLAHLSQFGLHRSHVNLSERVTPSARLQNRACDFRRTRLLNVFCFVMQHGTRDSLVTVSVEQLEVGLLVVPVVTVHMMHL